MKNSDLIKALQALPEDAEVFIHVETDEDEFMASPTHAWSEFGCDDEHVVRIMATTDPEDARSLQRAEGE